MSDSYPTRLALHQGRLLIEWSSGPAREYTVRELREACPCAGCREKRRAPPAAALLPVLKPEETAPLAIKSMSPVGNYAYSIAFSDGHDTGIFTLEQLAQIGSPVGEDPSRKGSSEQ